MVEYDKRTCHYADADKGCTYFDCDDCRYFYKDKEKNMSEISISNDLKCMTFSKNDISRIENESYNQALEDFAEKILNWKPQDEEYRSFKDVVNEIKEQLMI